MNRKSLFDIALVALIGLAMIVVSVAVAADDTKSAAGAGAGAGAAPAAARESGPKIPEMKLPPGWTQEDMQACMAAGTPGKMQALLAGEAGTWQGKQTMWMAPGAEPMSSDVTSTVKTLMDGRYTQVEVSGDTAGMGPFQGVGIYGYDNVSGKFVGNWLDSHSTGIMTGTGELSSDGKQINWTFNYNCPIAKKPVTMRQTETIGAGNTKVLEMFGVDPKGGGGGKEFKMMRIEMTRK